jgi:predicted nucleotidyltransferase
MSDPLVEEALRRRAIFDNLERYLARLKEVVQGVDPDAEVYLFGSVAEKRHSYSSDIDILIITEKERIEVLEALAKEEFAEIFDLHVRKPADTEWYKRHTNLVKL